MNAIYLHKPDGTPTEWSQCGECGQVACPGNFDLSQKCCTCYDCGRALPKDERVRYGNGSGNNYSLYHRECERKRRRKHEAEVLEKAELVTGYDGPVYCDGVHGSYGDGYCANVEELAEILGERDEEESSPRPLFAFCCAEQPFPGIRLDNIIESLTDEMDADASERLTGVDELRAACEIFTKANAGVISWYLDNTRKVAVPAREAN